MPSALIPVMSTAIEKVRMPLLRDFGELDRLHVSKKGTADFVTNADIRTERTLVEELTKARKGWGFLTEEDPDIAGDGECGGFARVPGVAEQLALAGQRD